MGKQANKLINLSSTKTKGNDQSQKGGKCLKDSTLYTNS